MADEAPVFGGNSGIKAAGSYPVPFQHLQKYRSTGGSIRYRPTGVYFGGISYFTGAIQVRFRQTTWRVGDRLQDLRNGDVYQITKLIFTDRETQVGANDIRNSETTLGTGEDEA